MKINDWNFNFDNHFIEMIDEMYLKNNINPKKENLFKVFELINPNEVKVVILGQDPYPNENDANGIAFSVDRKNNLPASLKNIYKELENDLKIKRENGDLSDLVKQGVLFMNTVLTCETNKARSHNTIGWQKYTNDIIKELDENVKPIFVLLGNDAKKYKKILKYSVVIETSHPSPLSAYRGFNGSKIFSQINNNLKLEGKQEINWSDNE